MSVGCYLDRTRSKSLPVHVLQTKKNASVGRLNSHRKSVQLQLTCTLMTQESMKPKNGCVNFPSSVLMQVAITNGDESEIHKLISEFGTSIIDEPEPSGLPPVMRAIFEGQINSLEVLIDAGADLTACDSEDWNVLHVAAAMDDYEAAELIISSCSDPSIFLQAQNVCGEKPIDLAEEENMIQYLETESAKTCFVSKR